MEDHVDTEDPALSEAHASSGDDTDTNEESRVSVQERVEGLMRGVIAVLKHHRAPELVLMSLKGPIWDWLVSADESLFVERAKYFTTLWMAVYLRNDPPSSAKLGSPMPRSGHWHRWFKTRLRRITRRNTHLWYSIFQAKRSCLPASEDLVDAAYAAHRVSMQTEDPLVDSDFDELKVLGSGLLKKLSLRVAELYRPTSAGVVDGLASECLGQTGVSDWHASSRACYEATRSSGGQLGFLTSLAHGDNSRLLLQCKHCNAKQFRHDNDPDLWDEESDEEVVFSCRRCPDTIISQNLRDLDLDELTELEPSFVRSTSVYLEDGEWREEDVWAKPDSETAWEYATTKILWERPLWNISRLPAKICAVIEPLKIRVISKGSAQHYYCSRGLQKALHGTLRKIPCFRLIGRPLDATLLMDINRPGDVWLSADYKAATDNLSARLSAWILEQLTQGHPYEWRRLWQLVLAPHDCEYPSKSGVEPVRQTNGQLMGSILSFPVLCLANLLLFLWFEKKCGRRATLKSACQSVLINGDDLVARINRSEFPIFQDLARRIGLPLSVGKTYVHEKVLNVNSTCYHYHTEHTPQKVCFLNTGLLFGQGKVMSHQEADGSEVVETRHVTSTFNEYVQGALPGRQCEAAADFIRQNTETLQNECRGRNMFLPEALGGMGCVPPLGFSVKFNSGQKRLAKQLWESDRYLYVHDGVAPFRAIPARSGFKADYPWSLLSLEQREKRSLKRSRINFSVRRFVGRQLVRSPVPRECTWDELRIHRIRLELAQRHGRMVHGISVVAFRDECPDGVLPSIESIESALPFGELVLPLMEQGLVEENRNPLL